MARIGGEEGSATTQVVIVTPVLLGLVMLVFQFALYQHASHVVTAAAQHGVAQAQVEQGSTASGRHAAEAFLASTNRGLLRSPRVDVSRSSDRTRVVVRSEVISLVPGFRFTVTGISDGPTERFWARTER